MKPPIRAISRMVEKNRSTDSCDRRRKLFNRAVRLTDNWFNAVGLTSRESAQIQLLTTDPFAPGIGAQLISAGASNFSAPFSTYKFQTRKHQRLDR